MRKRSLTQVIYKMDKKEVKKAVTLAKDKAYERLYQRLETKDGEKDVFKLPRGRGRETRDLGNVRSIRDEEGKVLVDKAKICERWQSYFYKLFGCKNNGGFWTL